MLSLRKVGQRLDEGTRAAAGLTRLDRLHHRVWHDACELLQHGVKRRPVAAG